MLFINVFIEKKRRENIKKGLKRKSVTRIRKAQKTLYIYDYYIILPPGANSVCPPRAKNHRGVAMQPIFARCQSFFQIPQNTVTHSCLTCSHQHL